jgi:hypothetical protein
MEDYPCVTVPIFRSGGQHTDECRGVVFLITKDEFPVPLPLDHIVACCERVVPYAERERRMEAEIQIASLRVRCWGHQTDGDGCYCKI